MKKTFLVICVALFTFGLAAETIRLSCMSVHGVGRECFDNDVERAKYVKELDDAFCISPSQ